jgi:hypothetical protein
MKSLIDEFKELLNNGKFFNWDKHVHIYHEVNNSDYLEKELKFSISTEKHEYIIRAIERENGKNYLGCIVNNRAPWPGENHTRGNDLADGDLCQQTWINILTDIISLELIEIPEKQVPSQIECEETCSLQEA